MKGLCVIAEKMVEHSMKVHRSWDKDRNDHYLPRIEATTRKPTPAAAMVNQDEFPAVLSASFIFLSGLNLSGNLAYNSNENKKVNNNIHDN